MGGLGRGWGARPCGRGVSPDALPDSLEGIHPMANGEPLEPTFPMHTGRRTPGYQALRRSRLSLVGQVYLVTFTTLGRRVVFDEFARGCTACRALTDSRLWSRSRLLAWVLMPDHWHGVVELGEGERLDAVVRRLKANASRAVRREEASLDRVWADGFHDHAIRQEEELVDVARYVVLNPVRARIAASVWRYPFWDAIWVGVK